MSLFYFFQLGILSSSLLAVGCWLLAGSTLRGIHVCDDAQVPLVFHFKIFIFMWRRKGEDPRPHHITYRNFVIFTFHSSLRAYHTSTVVCIKLKVSSFPLCRIYIIKIVYIHKYKKYNSSYVYIYIYRNFKMTRVCVIDIWCKVDI